LAITVSFVTAWVLAEGEQAMCRWVGSLWRNGAFRGALATAYARSNRQPEALDLPKFLS